MGRTGLRREWILFSGAACLLMAFGVITALGLNASPSNSPNPTPAVSANVDSAPTKSLERPTHQPDINAATPLPPVPALNAGLVADGQRLYAQHCAACHGANLEGQPDWRKPFPNGRYPAPPQDDAGHSWHHGDPELYRIIFNGGNGLKSAEESGMPAFREVLSGRDAVAIVQFLKSRWSTENREYQWEMTTRAH